MQSMSTACFGLRLGWLRLKYLPSTLTNCCCGNDWVWWWWTNSYYKRQVLITMLRLLILHNIFVLEDDIDIKQYPIVVCSSISVFYIRWNMQWGIGVKNIVWSYCVKLPQNTPNALDSGLLSWNRLPQRRAVRVKRCWYGCIWGVGGHSCELVADSKRDILHCLQLVI